FEPVKGAPVVTVAPVQLAARVKEVFRARCLECHGGSRTVAGVRGLDHEILVKRKKKIVPGKPDDSPLFQLVTASDESVMPPPGQPRLAVEDIDAIRQWIVAGAPPFPADAPRPAEKNKDRALQDVAGVDYVLKQILAHVRGLGEEERP